MHTGCRNIVAMSVVDLGSACMENISGIARTVAGLGCVDMGTGSPIASTVGHLGYACMGGGTTDARPVRKMTTSVSMECVSCLVQGAEERGTVGSGELRASRNSQTRDQLRKKKDDELNRHMIDNNKEMWERSKNASVVGLGYVCMGNRRSSAKSVEGLKYVCTGKLGKHARSVGGSGYACFK